MIEKIVLTIMLFSVVLLILGAGTGIYRAEVADNRKLEILQYTAFIGMAVCFISAIICGIIAMWI